MGGDALQLRAPVGSLFLLPYMVKRVDFGGPPSDGDGDDDEGGAIKLCHSLENSRALHMMAAGVDDEEEEEEEDEGMGGSSGSESESEGGSKNGDREEQQKGPASGSEDEEEEEEMEEGADDEDEEQEEEEEGEAPSHPLDVIPGMIFPRKFARAVALLAQGKVRVYMCVSVGWVMVGGTEAF